MPESSPELEKEENPKGFLRTPESRRKAVRKAKWAGALILTYASGCGVLDQEKIEATAPPGAIEVETDKIGHLAVKVRETDLSKTDCGEVKAYLFGKTPVIGGLIPIVHIVDRDNPRKVDDLGDGLFQVNCERAYGQWYSTEE